MAAPLVFAVRKPAWPLIPKSIGEWTIAPPAVIIADKKNEFTGRRPNAA
jgi:hypothetical protein